MKVRPKRRGYSRRCWRRRCASGWRGRPARSRVAARRAATTPLRTPRERQSGTRVPPPSARPTSPPAASRPLRPATLTIGRARHRRPRVLTGKGTHVVVRRQRGGQRAGAQAVARPRRRVQHCDATTHVTPSHQRTNAPTHIAPPPQRVAAPGLRFARERLRCAAAVARGEQRNTTQSGWRGCEG